MQVIRSILERLSMELLQNLPDGLAKRLGFVSGGVVIDSTLEEEFRREIVIRKHGGRTLKIRPIAWVVAPDGEPIYSEKATKILIDDEGGGEFIAIAQGDREIRIDLEEWPSIEHAVKMALENSSHETGHE